MPKPRQGPCQTCAAHQPRPSQVGDAFLHLIEDKEANGTIIRVEGATPGGEDKPFTVEEVQLTSRVVRTIKQLDKPKPGQVAPENGDSGKAVPENGESGKAAPE